MAIGTENMRSVSYHLVFKVLGGNKRVQQILSASSLDRLDLATGSCDVRVEIKDLPELVDRSWSWSGSNIQQDADARVEDGSECIEEPAMRVELFGILFLETEHDLDRCIVARVGRRDLHCRINRHLRSVLFQFENNCKLQR